MSILPQELLRKISTRSNESSERIRSSDHPDESFKKLMKVSEVEDNPKEKGVFSFFEKEEDEEDEILAVNPSNIACLPPSNPLGSDPITPSLAIAAYLSSADAAALFEQMASAMIMMSSSGEMETTLFLDNDRFASSVFFGSKITIREFSTAPKAFNIEIASPPLAIASLNAGLQSLLSAFQNGNFNFSVHRIDTSLQQLEKRPVLHRKEGGEHEEKDQRRGHEQ